ncbi:GNAT family N-acetyltransferase [Clostridium sp. DSM 100503]|uniref:GNAT family N-acetyltransferase n=1 Tax=Clostridium sp. DSM 100503 TaxID=2963282 RepID=UPI00214A7770|nr:GNAT family protein [Clostridium sp. DSM 100503]MCR1949965.1 GNAT family N-acetyltransferase [Clostridium sp. DSM 100503]
MKFNDYFNEIPYLETDKLILRAFCRADIEEYLSFINLLQVQRFLGGGLSIFNEEPHISNWLNNINGRLLKSKKAFTWCIESKIDNKVIGRIDLGGFSKKSIAELSYYFSLEYWGRGFATEAVKEVTRFGFIDLKLHRIQAKVMPTNTASLVVLKKVGYLEEGLLRKCLFGKEFHDTIVMALVNEDNIKK